MKVTTIHGEMDELLLEKRTGFVDTENEYTEWIEYWLDGELVHRSVNMQLKEGAISSSIAGVFS